MAAAEKAVPPEKHNGAPLYRRMMKAIASDHTFGNRVRMLKLPLIFAEEKLYAGAIAQFFWVSEALELALREHSAHPMVTKVRSMGLEVTPGYASDLQELYGPGWRAKAEEARMEATSSYMQVIEKADPVSLAAAAFILYGALVVGGGKATQARVRKVIPTCQHRLFDVADDMKQARKQFQETFNAIGKEWPEHFERLVQESARFMALNNTIVLSIRCWGRRATAVALGVALTGVAAFAAARVLRRVGDK